MTLIPRFWGAGGGGGYSPYPLPDDWIYDPGYWFAADYEAFSDDVGTACVDGAAVRQWNNQGNVAENASQATLARRPIFREGGQNGQPYVEVRAASQQYFADLALRTLAAGLTINGWKMGLFVGRIENIGNGLIKPLFGSSATTKSRDHFESDGDYNCRKPASSTTGQPLGDGQVHALAWFHDQTTLAWMKEDGVFHSIGSANNFSSIASTSSNFLRQTNTTVTGGGTAYFDGDIYELMNFSNPGSDISSASEEALLDQAIAYAVAKYAL